jgi:hypothetical protein
VMLSCGEESAPPAECVNKSETNFLHDQAAFCS